MISGGTGAAATKSTRAPTAAGGSGTNRESQHGRNGKVPGSSREEHGSHQQRHRGRSSSSSGTGSSSGHKRLSDTAQGSVRVDCAQGGGGGAGEPGEPTGLPSGKGEEKHKHAERQRREKDKHHKVRHRASETSGSSSGHHHGDERRSGGETKHVRENRVKARGAQSTAAPSEEAASHRKTCVKADTNSKAANTGDEIQDTKTYTFEDAKKEHRGGVPTAPADAAAEFDGRVQSAQRASPTPQDGQQRASSHCKPHKSHQERHQEKGGKEKKSADIRVPHSKHRDHAAGGGESVSSTAPGKEETVVAVNAKGKKETPCVRESHGRAPEPKEDRTRREKRKDTDARESRTEKRKRRSGEDQNSKVEGPAAEAAGGEKTKKGRHAGDGTSGHRHQRHGHRELSPALSLQQPGALGINSASAVSGGALCVPVEADVSTGSSRRSHKDRDSGNRLHSNNDLQPDMPSKSTTVLTRNADSIDDGRSDGVTRCDSNSTGEKRESGQGERLDPKKKSHRHADENARDSSSSHGSHKGDAKKVALECVARAADGGSYCPFLENAAENAVEEQEQRGRHSSSNGCGACSSSSKHKETTQFVDEKKRTMSAREGQHGGPATATVTGKAGRTKDKKKSRRVEGGVSSTNHSSNGPHGDHSNSTTTVKTRKEDEPREQKHTRQQPSERNGIEHAQKQKADSTGTRHAGVVGNGEAAVTAQPHAEQGEQRQRAHPTQHMSSVKEAVTGDTSANEAVRQQQSEHDKVKLTEGGARHNHKRQEKERHKSSSRLNKSKKGRAGVEDTNSSSLKPCSQGQQETAEQRTGALQEENPTADGSEVIFARHALDALEAAAPKKETVLSEKPGALRGREGGGEIKRASPLAAGAAAAAAATTAVAPVVSVSASRGGSAKGSRSHSSSRNASDGNLSGAAAATQGVACGAIRHSSGGSRDSVSSSKRSTGSGGQKKVVQGQQLARSGSTEGVKASIGTDLSSKIRANHHSSPRQSVRVTQSTSSPTGPVGSSRHEGHRNSGEAERSRTNKQQTRTGGGSGGSTKKQQCQRESQDFRAKTSECSDTAASGQDRVVSLSSSATAASAEAVSIAAAAAEGAVGASRTGAEETGRDEDSQKRSSISRSNCRSSSSIPKGGLKNRKRRSSVRRNHSSRSRSRTGSWDSRAASRRRSRSSSGSRRRSSSRRRGKCAGHQRTRRRRSRGRHSSSEDSSRSGRRRVRHSGRSSRSCSSSGGRSCSRSRSTSTSTSSRRSRSRTSSGSNSDKSSRSRTSSSRSSRSRSSRSRSSRSRSSRSGSSRSGSSHSHSSRSRSRCRRRSRSSGSSSSRDSRSRSRSTGSSSGSSSRSCSSRGTASHSGDESGRSSSRSSTSSGVRSSRRRRRRRSRSRSSSRSTFVILNTADPTRNSQGDPFPPDLHGPCYIKVLPRTRDPPVVLGIDNRGLIRLAKLHGCKLKLSAVDDVFPNTDRRLLLIYGGATANCVHALQDWVRKTAVKKPEQQPDKLRGQKNSPSSSGGADARPGGQPQEEGAQQQPAGSLLQKKGQQQQLKGLQQLKGRQQQREEEDDAQLEAELTFVIAQNAVRHMRISPWSSLDLTEQPAASPATLNPASSLGTGEAAARASAAAAGGDGAAVAAGDSGAVTPAPAGPQSSAAHNKLTTAVKQEEQEPEGHSSQGDDQAEGQQRQHDEGQCTNPETQRPPAEEQQTTPLGQQLRRELSGQQHQPLEPQQQQHAQQPASTSEGGKQEAEETGTAEMPQQQQNGRNSTNEDSSKQCEGTTVVAGAAGESASKQDCATAAAASLASADTPAGLPSGKSNRSSVEAGGAPTPDGGPLEQQQQQAVHQQLAQEKPLPLEYTSASASSQQGLSLTSASGVEVFSIGGPSPQALLSFGQQHAQALLSPEQLEQQQQDRLRQEQERLLRQRSVWPTGTLLRDLHHMEGARVKLSRRQEMRWGCRERLLTLRGSLQSVQRALACVSFSLQFFLQQRDYMNVKYVRYTEERRRRRRSPSPLPTVPRIVLQEPALPSALVPGLQFQRVLQGLNVQDELVRMTNLRGIIDRHVVEMRGPAYVKVVISDLVTTLLLGTVKSEMENKSCPLRVIEKTCGVQAKVMDPEMPGILERVLVISGQPASVDKATMAVLEKVYAACIMAGQASQVTWRMCASNSAASLIIGTGGHRVKQLRHITNTRIQINTRDNVPVVDRWERVVTITGTYAAVAAAARAMLPFMHADPNHGQHVHQCYGTGTRLEMPEWAEQAVQREGMDEEAGRRPPLPDDRDVSFTGPCFLKLLIDNALANALIGRECQTIIALSEATQCVMKFAPATTVFPGCQGERVLGLSGSAEAINNAAIAIIEKCKEVHPNLSYDQMYGKMIVPHTCCSSIIGAGGSRIREIREATLTRIAVSKKGLNTPERLVCIFGMPQGVHTALVTIFGIIQCDPGIRVMLDIVYPPEIEGDSKKKEADRLSVGLIGAVLEGVQAVVNKVGVDETAEAALKKLQEMQRAAAIAAGELPPDGEEGEFRGPLGPMGQTRGAAQHTNYSAPISFIPASSHLPSTAASEASLAMLQEDGLQGSLRGSAVAGGGSPSHHMQTLNFGMPGRDAAAAAEMDISTWSGGAEAAAGSSSGLLQLQAAESNAPLGISRTASVYADATSGQLLSEAFASRSADAAAAAGLPYGGGAGAAGAQQGMWGTEQVTRQQQQLTRQEKRQRLLEASLNRGLGAAAAREERQLTAAGEHISGGGEEEQHDDDEDLSLAGLMDEKF